MADPTTGDFITLTSPDGITATYEYPGFSAYTPEQQEQRRKQIERDWRVGAASKGLVAQNDARSPAKPGGLINQAEIAVDEFARNFTGGLDAYAGALMSDTSSPDSPMAGLPFLERRDAYRRAQDIRETRLPDWANTGSSLAGVLGLGALFPVRSLPQTVASGGALGLIEGVGNSPAQDLPGVFEDGAVSAGIGAATGGVIDAGLNYAAGGAARRMFARPGTESREAYLAQKALGLEPSIGSIGNANAARLENSFAEAPLIASVSAALPESIPLPTKLLPDWMQFSGLPTEVSFGRSAMNTRTGQEETMRGLLGEKVTDPMRGGPSLIATDADLAASAEQRARQGVANIEAEKKQLEADLAQVVPPNAPVDMRGVRQVPGDIEAAGQSANLADRMRAEIGFLDRNMRNASPIDPARHQQLQIQEARVRADIRNVETLIEQLRGASGPNLPQIGRLERTLRGYKKALDKNLENQRANMGPPFAAVRQDRGQIGKNTEKGGLAGYEASRLLGPVNDALTDTAERFGAGQQFRDVRDRERAMFLDEEVLARYAEGKASQNTSYLRQAMLQGNWDELSVLFRNLRPNEALAFKADLIDSLGRKGNEEFSTSSLYNNWRRMPDAAKDRLFANDPEGRVLADTIAEVAGQFAARGGESNHSRTAAVSSVLTGLGAAVVAPRKILPFLATTLGLERAVVSEAMAKAVAGQRSDFGELVRRAVIMQATAGREPPPEDQEGPQ